MPEYDFSQTLERPRSWKWNEEGSVDGHAVLPMSVADTDFLSPREVTEALREIIDGGEFGYSCYPEDHCEVFAAWQKRQHGWAPDPADVIISHGLLGSLVMMLDAVSAPGDGIILFPPVYHSFFEVVAGAARVPVCCDLICDAQNRWHIDLEAFQRLCESNDTTAVIVCNPHNPVGRAWGVDELRSLIAIAQANDVIVFSDEIHADFVYDLPFNPALAAAEDKRGIMTLTSGGKTFNIGGLFSSYAVSEDAGLKEMLQAALDRLHWHQNTFSAWGSYVAFKHGHRYRDEVVTYVRDMQTRLVEAINRMPFPVKAVLPEATYLLWIDFRETGWSADELHRFLVEEAGLGLNRGDSFGANGAGFARINCAVPQSRIDEAIRRLQRAFEQRLGK